MVIDLSDADFLWKTTPVPHSLQFPFLFFEGVPELIGRLEQGKRYYQGQACPWVNK
jgi:hypothetical protein